MEERRGKLPALSLMAAGIAILTISGFVLKDWLIEEWYIRKLSGDDRAMAIEKLGELQSRRAIPYLLRELGREVEADGDGEVEADGDGHSRRALGKIGLPAVTPLAALLGDATLDPSVRRRAALALGEIGPEAQAAVPDLVAFLSELEGRADAAGRCAAVIALGRIGPGAREALPALLAALDDPSADIRGRLAEALPRIDPESSAVLDALTTLSKDKTHKVHSPARRELNRIRDAKKP